MPDPITMGIGLVKTFIGKFVKDKDLAAKLVAQAESEKFQGVVSLAMGQIATNQEEAKHSSVFVAGWRPFVGWVCGVSLAYNFIFYPFMKFLTVILMDDPPGLPELSIGELVTILLGMLGLGGLRTYEKGEGVARSKI